MQPKRTMSHVRETLEVSWNHFLNNVNENGERAVTNQQSLSFIEYFRVHDRSFHLIEAAVHQFQRHKGLF